MARLPRAASDHPLASVFGEAKGRSLRQSCTTSAALLFCCLGGNLARVRRNLDYMRRLLGFALGCAILYAVGTAALGYDQGRNYVGEIGALFGPTLSENAIRQHSPDWETISPTFWLGVERGRHDALTALRVKNGDEPGPKPTSIWRKVCPSLTKPC